jgi:hypothetical protein
MKKNKKIDLKESDFIKIEDLQQFKGGSDRITIANDPTMIDPVSTEKFMGVAKQQDSIDCSMIDPVSTEKFMGRS